VDVIDPSAPGLLFIQAQFSIGLLGKIVAAGRQQTQQREGNEYGRFLLQVTIMFWWAGFWEPPCRWLRMTVAIKRAYEKPAPSDGQRVLVDRLWPRGVSKDQARVHHWLRSLAPSDQLREWFHASSNWLLFKKRYFQELATGEADAEMERLYALLERHSKITLLYASRNETQNNAAALKELLDGTRKPPSSSGPAAAAAAGRVAKRRPRA
jgi:uncharacterized protein YeaO (DUF488 family)